MKIISNLYFWEKSYLFFTWKQNKTKHFILWHSKIVWIFDIVVRKRHVDNLTSYLRKCAELTRFSLSSYNFKVLVIFKNKELKPIIVDIFISLVSWKSFFLALVTQCQNIAVKTENFVQINQLFSNAM